MHRALTIDELRVLQVVQSKFGPQNGENRVVIHGMGEAVIWAQDESSATVMMVNLTVLAGMLEDGTIDNDNELARNWLAR